MKKVIITGANSFVGSAVVHECVKNNIEVIAVVRNQQSNIENIKNLENIKIVYCELSNIKNIENIITDREIDVFYHFAWEGVSNHLAGDYITQLRNIEFTCDAIKSCKAIKCNKFIFANSIISYESLSVIENNITPTIKSVYGISKLSSDYILQAMSSGLIYISVVISNIYGHGENSPRFVNSTLRKLLHHKHVSCTLGTQIYDFIYIDDAAKAFFEIGNKCNISKKYYLGSENPRPLKEFLEEMKNCVDSSIELGYGEVAFNNAVVDYSKFDLEGVKNDTGFVPEVDFKSGILKTIEYLNGECSALLKGNLQNEIKR